MRTGFIAVDGTADRFAVVFASVWPSYEIVKSEALPSLDAFLEWKQVHERFVAAMDWTPEVPGIDVYAFCQDGPWALLLDASLVLPSDDEALVKLSNSFSRCVSFIHDTNSGSTSCALFAQGVLQRRIEIETEAKKMLHELGLSVPVESLCTQYHAIATADRTDYSELARSLREKAALGASTQGRKPWWKVW